MKDQTVEGDSAFSRDGGDLEDKKGVVMGQGIRESGLKPLIRLPCSPHAGFRWISQKTEESDPGQGPFMA